MIPWKNQASGLSCTALCRPMRWLVSLSQLCTAQLRPHPYRVSKGKTPWPTLVHCHVSQSLTILIQNIKLFLYKERLLKLILSDGNCQQQFKFPSFYWGVREEGLGLKDGSESTNEKPWFDPIDQSGTRIFEKSLKLWCRRGFDPTQILLFALLSISSLVF